MNKKPWLLTVSAIYVVLAAAAVTVPRFVARGLDGLHASTVAAMWFLSLGVAALVASVVPLVITAMGWKQLSVALRVVGLAPIGLSLVAMLAIAVYLINK